jgi:hypothetical protein
VSVWQVATVVSEELAALSLRVECGDSGLLRITGNNGGDYVAS